LSAPKRSKNYLSFEAGAARRLGHPSGVPTNCSLLSGGLRYAATTGYYLTALQADMNTDTGNHLFFDILL
jgi:hypothetical protein